MARYKRQKSQKQKTGVSKSSGGSSASRRKKRKSRIEADLEEDVSEVEDIVTSEEESPRPSKTRKKRKNDAKKNVADNDGVDERQKLLLQLNGDRNAGKEAFEDEIKRLGDAADVDLRKNNSNAKTGVCFLTK